MPEADSYKIFFMNSPVAMWVFDAISLKILDVNKAAETLYGYDRKSFLDKSLNDLVLEMPPNEIPEYEFHKHQSGDHLRIKVKTSPIKFKNTDAQLSVLEDVTLKANIRKNLSDSEKKFMQIVDSAMDAIITTDSRQKIILFNKSAEKMFGYSAVDVLGRDLNLLIPSRFKDQHKKHIHKFGKTGTTNRKMGTLGTIYGSRSDGTEFPIEASISQVQYENEKLYTVILRDVSERLEAEEAKEKFKQLADSLNDVFYIVDPVKDETIYLSPSYEKVYERNVEDLLSGKEKWTDFIHPDDREWLAVKAQEAQKGEDFSEEFRILTPSGKTKWISSKAFNLKDNNGRVYRVTGIATDITDRKEDEEKLKAILMSEKEALKMAEASKDKLAFLADASEVLSSSLDYQQTLTTVAQLATPKFSDWCVVDILDDNGELNRLAVSHINPEKVELAIEIHKKYGPSKDEASGVYHVLRTGNSELYKVIPEELIREAAKDEEHLRISLELGLKSGMIVPLKARGQVFGTITLIYAESEKYYDESDLHLIEDLARRAGIAIDNARLYAQAQLLNSQLDQKIKDLQNEILTRENIEHILIENQEKLIESDERLKAALNASETGTYRLNKEDDRLDFDESLLKLFGLSPEESINYEKFITAVHPEDRNKLIQELERSSEENNDFELEYRITWKDGSTHWLLNKGKSFTDKYGIPQYLTGACVDITYRKHAEQTLRESEVMFRQLAENIRDIFFVLNPMNGNLVYISPVFEDIWGVAREEIYSNPEKYIEALHPDDRQDFQAVVQKAMTTGSYSTEFRVVKPDNSIRWLRSRGFPLYNDKNQLFRITGITEDITERKLAEEELHKSQEFLRSTVISAPVILWVVNLDWEITLLEGKGLEQIGINPGDYSGKNIFRIFKKTDEFKQNLNDVLQDKQLAFIIQENGTWQEMKLSPLKDNSGNIQGVIGVAVDITPHKEAEEKIMGSLKEKEVLLKEIHHRVKNNLQIISSILSLQSGYIDNEDIQGIFAESKDRVRSMALLHEKLYQTKDFTKINFKTYIEDLISNLFRSYQIETDKINLQVIGEDINIDAEKAISIGLIMNELISNSLKYAFKGISSGEIIVKFDRLESNSLLIEVKDSGVGLPPEFDINSTDTLGLQLISSLVEQLNGKIKVFNNKGAGFEIILPEITH